MRIHRFYIVKNVLNIFLSYIHAFGNHHQNIRHLKTQHADNQIINIFIYPKTTTN